MGTLENNIVSGIYYIKQGNGMAVVLIHGFPFSGAIWKTIVENLANEFTVIIPDLPGSGLSPLEQEKDIPQMAMGIKAILDFEKIDKAILVGHSMGGYIAFSFANQYPASVIALSIVHSTPIADDEEKIKNRKKIIDLIKNGGKSIFIKQMIPNLFAQDFKQTNSSLVEEITETALGNKEAALINYYNAMISRKDYSEELMKFDFPMQWIMGMEDNILNYTKNLEKCIKSNINFVHCYANCGHMSMIEKPEFLIPDLLKFFRYCNTQN